MRVQVISDIVTAKGILHVGQVLDIPESAIEKLEGKIAILCQARKTDGSVCNSVLKASTTGWLSCSNPFCQVPAPDRIQTVWHARQAANVV